MAKLGKQKFKFDGSYMRGRTTSRGQIELYLYYDNENDHFYFSRDELKKYLDDDQLPHNPNHSIFKDCKTKQMAIDRLMTLFVKEKNEKRMIRLDLAIPSKFWTIVNPKWVSADESSKQLIQRRIPNPELPNFLIDILKKDNIYKGSGITIKYERIMDIEFNGSHTYAACDENWEYTSRSLSHYGENLIEWSQGREDFIIGIMSKLDTLSEMIVDYLNEPNIEQFYLKMENNGIKLLGNND